MSAAAAARAADLALPGDALVWMHDAVALALASAVAPVLADAVRVFALRDDLHARGFADMPLRGGVATIGYAELVALCAAEHAVPVTWASS
jgi:sulfur relay protein TusB/DsrH